MRGAVRVIGRGENGWPMRCDPCGGNAGSAAEHKPPTRKGILHARGSSNCAENCILSNKKGQGEREPGETVRVRKGQPRWSL